MDEPPVRQADSTTPTRPHAGLGGARHSELSYLDAFVRGEHENTLLIVGDRGSGKSTLLSSIASAHPQSTHLVRVDVSERDTPLSGLSTMLAATRDPSLMRLSAELIDEHSQEFATGLPPRLLSAISTDPQTRMVVLVDNLDLMDHTSLTVITKLASRLGGTSLNLLATATAPATELLQSLPRLTLAPLSFADSMSVIETFEQPPINEAIRLILVEASHGNPGALRHHARALTVEQLAGDAPITMPFRVARASLDDAGDDPAVAARRVLLAQLSCSRLSSEEVVTRASGVAADRLDDLLAEGVVVRDRGYLRLSDPLLRSRVYWSLGAASRADYHASAARVELEHAPGLASWHRSWVQPSRVTPHELIDAATGFARAGFLFQAIELAERALALDLTTTPITLNLAELARTMLLRSELAHAVRYIHLAQRQPDASGIHTRLSLLRTWIEFMSSQQLSAIDVEHWGRADDSSSDAGRAAALASLALFHAERWETEQAREALKRAHQLPHAESTSAQQLLAQAEMVISAVEGDPAPTVQAFSQTPRHRTSERSPSELLLLGRSLTFIGRYDDARRVLKSIVGMEPSPQPLWTASASYAMAENDIFAGNHFEALATIDHLHSGRADGQLHRNARLLLRAWYWLAKDARDEAPEAIARCHRSFAAGDNPALSARLEAYQGAFALVHERLDEAIAFLGSAMSFATQLRLPAFLRYRVDLIEAHTKAGRQSEALAQFQEFRARSTPHRTQLVVLQSARAHALVTPGEASIGAFQQAVKLWRPGDSQFELGRILLCFADRLTELGHTQESKEQYLAARVIFTQLGAALWARRAESAHTVPQMSADNPHLSTLNWDEQVVASLVSRGLRNKEIAQELFVSLRTVEVRLTRIYHKLGVRSRSQLISMLGGLDNTPPDEASSRG